MSFELSVIISSFNTGSYINDAVESIVSDVPDAEIIVVDDASTDNTIENLHMMSWKNLKIISLATNSPGGAGFPSNVGIENAKGEYLAFLDSDDFFTEDICPASYSK